MDRPVSEHLTTLNRRISELSERLAQNLMTTIEHDRVESKLREARKAVEYYRKAIEIEKRIA